MKNVRRILQRFKFVVNLLILAIGAILIIVAVFIKPDTNGAAGNSEIIYDIMLGIGASVTATPLMTLILLALLPGDFENEEIKELEKWGISHIYGERESIKLTNGQLPQKNLDFIAFGLAHFRAANSGGELQKQIKNGLKIRIITLAPDSQFVAEQQRLENGSGLKSEIEALRSWQQTMISSLGATCKGRIEIKYYNSLPLDFYCRADKRVFAGPYMPGVVSGKVITYEFKSGSRGGKYYTKIFEALWAGRGLNYIELDVPHLVGNQELSIEKALEHFCTELAGSEKQDLPIGAVVAFKGEYRRTIFSCNKRRDEQHHCYPKSMGTVGNLIKLNCKLDTEYTILFEDLRNKLSFESHFTDALESQVKGQRNEVPNPENLAAILAIPITINNSQLIGAITFDFFRLPQKYEEDLERMKKMETGTHLEVEDHLEIQRWFELAESCRKVIEPMLGSEMKLQFKNLFEEEWNHG